MGKFYGFSRGGIMIIINDENTCHCGAYYQSNYYCTQGHEEK